MPEPLSTTAGGVKLASLLLEEAEKQGLIDKLKTYFKRKPRILLLGSTGVGKSQFLRSLVQAHPEPIARGDRTIFTSSQVLLVRKSPFRFVDPPGDASDAMKDVRSDKIREGMSARGGISGVINVVSYGYHEYDVAKKDVFLPDGKVDPQYLARHRQFEIDQLSEWTALLGSPKTIKWLITLVTKADLWRNDRDSVRQHYQTGDYNRALGDALSVNPRVLLYSSVFFKFYAEAPLSGYFDENDRRILAEQFVKALLASLLEREV